MFGLQSFVTKSICSEITDEDTLKCKYKVATILYVKPWLFACSNICNEFINQRNI